MSRILKRPMFRKGGSTSKGIMTGLVDRTKHADNPIVTGFDKDRLDVSTKAIMDLLSEYAPVPKTRLPIGQFGLNLASGMTITDALKDPYKQFTKSDDIRRAQIAKSGDGALTTALKLEMERAKNLGKTTRLLTDAEKLEQGFNKRDVVQIDSKGSRKVLKSIPAGEVEKQATREQVISEIDKILGSVDEQGTGLLEGFIKGKTTPINPKRAQFEAQVKGLELNVIKALRGAQVSAAEEDNVKKILPSVFDSETMFKAKAKALQEYMSELNTRIKGGVVGDSQSAILEKGLPGQKYQKKLEEMSEEELKAYEEYLLTTQQLKK